MRSFSVSEAKFVLGLSEAPELQPTGGLGDLIFRIETADGRSEEAYIIEIDGESSRGGALLGGMPPDSAHRLIAFEDMIWIAAGFLD